MDKSSNSYKRYLPIKIGKVACAALMDSGNLFKNCISPALLARLGLNETDLKVTGTTRLATAKEGAEMKILGELKKPIYLDLGGSGIRIKDRPTVVRGLSMAFNLCGPFMKAHGIDQLHSRDSVRFQGKEFKLLLHPDDLTTGPEATHSHVYMTDAVELLPGAVKEVQLRATEVEKRAMPAGDGFLQSGGTFKLKYNVTPLIGELVKADCDGNLVAGVWNTTKAAIKVPRGVQFGVFTLAVHPEKQHLYPWRIAAVGANGKQKPVSVELDHGPRTADCQKGNALLDGLTKQVSQVNRSDAIELKLPPTKKEALQAACRQLAVAKPPVDFGRLNRKAQETCLIEQFKLRDSLGLKSQADIMRAVGLLMKYADILSFDGNFGKTGMVVHRIITDPASQPVKVKNRPLSPGLEPALKEQMDAWMKHGVIEHSSSPWSFPIVAVAKKNKGVRFCIDYRLLNKVTKKDSFPLPHIEDNLARLARAKLFSCIDGCGAYHVVEVDKRDREKTAFATPWGLFQFKRLPFGLANAPATYCRLVQMVLDGIPSSIALPYVDDTCIHSQTLDEHFKALDAVFLAHRKAGLRLQPSKCQLFRTEVEYLGHSINEQGVKPLAKYTAAVTQWPVPSTRTEARAFLGKVGYYRRFIENYGALSNLWTDVTGKGTAEEERTRLTVTNDMREAFEKLKVALVTAPILAYPRFGEEDEPFILDTDWSQDFNTIGGVLSQVQEGEERVISYGAKKLSASQKNYSPTKGELFAIVHFIRLWRYYLRHRKFILRTDHAALQWIRTMEAPQGMIARWFETLANHEFEPVYRPGPKHGNADALSRISHAEAADEDEEDAELLASILPVRPDWTNASFRLAQMADKDLKEVRNWLEQCKEPEREAKRALSHVAKVYLGLYPQLFLDTWDVVCRIQDSKIWKCLPANLWIDAIKYVHQVGAHTGRDPTVTRLSRTFFFPGMKKEVERFVRGCRECQTKPNAPPKEQRHTHMPTQDGYPFQRVAIDFVGPFVKSHQGSRFILTVRDTFTRWMEAFAMKESKSLDVCRTLEREIFCRYGCPEQIHSDNGTQFTARQLEEIGVELGIKLTTTPAYNPKSNPVERSHRDLGPALKALCQRGDPDKWEDYLPQVLFALRTNVCSSTGLAPYQLLFGRDASQTIDFLFGNPPTESRGKRDHHHYARELRKRVNLAQTWARENIAKAVMRQSRNYHGEKKLFLPQTKVWLFTPTNQKDRGKKLSTYWSGPWTITETIGTLLYTIEPHANWPGRIKTQTVGIDRLKLYNPPLRPGYPEMIIPPDENGDLTQMGNELMEFIPVAPDNEPKPRPKVIRQDNMGVSKEDSDSDSDEDQGDDGPPRGGGTIRIPPPANVAIPVNQANGPLQNAQPNRHGNAQHLPEVPDEVPVGDNRDDTLDAWDAYLPPPHFEEEDEDLEDVVLFPEPVRVPQPQVHDELAQVGPQGLPQLQEDMNLGLGLGPPVVDREERPIRPRPGNYYDWGTMGAYPEEVATPEVAVPPRVPQPRNIFADIEPEAPDPVEQRPNRQRNQTQFFGNRVTRRSDSEEDDGPGEPDPEWHPAGSRRGVAWNVPVTPRGARRRQPTSGTRAAPVPTPPLPAAPATPAPMAAPPLTRRSTPLRRVPVTPVTGGARRRSRSTSSTPTRPARLDPATTAPSPLATPTRSRNVAAEANRIQRNLVRRNLNDLDPAPPDNDDFTW